MPMDLLLADAAPLELGLRLRFSVLHFLEFAIWGAWFVVLGNYLNSLGFSRKAIGSIFATMPIGAIIIGAIIMGFIIAIGFIIGLAMGFIIFIAPVCGNPGAWGAPPLPWPIEPIMAFII